MSAVLKKAIEIQVIPDEQFAELLESLEWCVRVAMQDYSAAVFIAQVLASLYNGNRVKCDMSRIFNLDHQHFSRLMDAIRLCHVTRQEPHQFFFGDGHWTYGNHIFEHIIERHGFEKKRRARS